MEFEKSALLRRSESSSRGDHPRTGFRRTSPLVSTCHPNWRGRDGWTEFPSRTASPPPAGGTDTGIFGLHYPSTCVHAAQGVLVQSHPHIFDRRLICGVILWEELFLYVSNVSSCQFCDLGN